MVRMVQTDLSRLERSLLGALIVIDVHSRDVVDDMINKSRVESETNFEWTR